MKDLLLKYAKKLRKDPTQAEKLLWSKLRARQMAGVKFRRQHPIGNYIVDLVSFEKKIIIELDGGQHTTQTEADKQRDSFLQRNGFKVLRFWNHQVFLELEAVLEVISRECLQQQVKLEAD